MKLALIAVGIIIVASCMLNAAETTTAEDSRFTQQHDKDHPWGFTPNFSERAAWEARAETLRHQALVALGLWPLPPKTPLNPVVHGKIDRDAYTIEKVFFASMPGHYVSGNLYRPKGKSGKLPAVLCPYGHWPDGRFIWRDDNGVNKDLASGAEKDPVTARTPLQANCAMLARMGCIVFQYDMVGYCDSTKIPHREGFLDTESILRLQSFMGLQTWNSIRSMDFVLSLPDVDPERVAVTGSSSGGTQTMALDACDPRAAVAFPMVMVGMGMQGGCVCENAPLYRVQTNNVEIASLFAPKPEGMAAANDFTIEFMKRGLPEMKSIWSLYGVADQVWGEHYEFPHNHNLHSREAQYNFLNKQLKLGLPEPVKEVPFEPVPPKDLSVYDTDHPRPTDELDAAALRKQMTQTSGAQIAAMPADERAKMLRVALQAMVVDQMPAASEVELSEPPPGELFLRRKGSGEQVPYSWKKPKDFEGGTFVIWVDPQGGAAWSQDPAVQKLVDRGFAVIAVQPFMSGDFKPLPKPPAPAQRRANANPAYSAYNNGYERTILANRVHDLLTAIAAFRAAPRTKAVYLVGRKGAGVEALLTAALAGDAINRAAIDLDHFDFDQVKSDTDPMLLPGALKYGGVLSFASLCSPDSTLLCNPPESFAPRTTGPKIGKDSSAMIDWLLEAK